MKAVYLKPGVLTPSPKAPGEWRFVDAELRQECTPPPRGVEGLLSFACPAGTGLCGAIRVGNGFKPTGGRGATWEWNGSIEAPTLKPSINCLARGPNCEEYAGCGWHSWLTDGEWGKSP
jgi:hypothetical protein